MSPAMGRFEFIEHTADKGFRVEGSNLQELFEISVLGMAKILRKNRQNASICYYQGIKTTSAGPYHLTIFSNRQAGPSCKLESVY